MDITLSVLPGRYAICRLNADDTLPAWAHISPGSMNSPGFVSITRTGDELSIVCPESEVHAPVRCDRGWRILKVEGPLDLSLTGVIAGLATRLAEAGVSIFAVSTFDTDHLFVKDDRLSLAVGTLVRAGYRVHTI